jgi:DNA polymerase-3 subunit epsilon
VHRGARRRGGAGRPSRAAPDLVLLDVMMPHKTGFEVCQELRADEALKDTLILMLTAKGRDTDVAKGLALGADAYMTKPFSTKRTGAEGARAAGAVPRNRPDRRRWLAVAAARRVLALLAGGWPAALVWSTLDARASALLVACWIGAPPLLVVMGCCWWLARGGCARAVPAHGGAGAPARRAGAGAGHRRPAQLSSLPGRLADVQALRVMSSWPAARDRCAPTSRAGGEGQPRVEQERSRLAALMSELTQSVVVCNLDGRVLLYNNRARCSSAPCRTRRRGAGRGAELIGLGRSIYTVFDRQLVAHALDNIQQRMQRGVASPSAQFVTTTRGGQLLRAQMAPVRAMDDATTRRGSAASC